MEVSEKLLKPVPEESKRFVKEFFMNAPKQLDSAMNIITFAATQPLMNTDDSCTHVYILLNGRLQAVEERVSETPYHFTEITPIEIVGDYELFTGAGGRYVTVTAAEPSRLLAIQAGPYLNWIRQDANALFLRTRMLMKQVTDQGLSERQRFVWDNRLRFLSFLVMECRRAGRKQFPIRLEYTREEMSSLVGCSVRTLNRIIKLLLEEGAISSYKGKLCIGEMQYETLLRDIRQMN